MWRTSRMKLLPCMVNAFQGKLFELIFILWVKFEAEKSFKRMIRIRNGIFLSILFNETHQKNCTKCPIILIANVRVYCENVQISNTNLWDH